MDRAIDGPVANIHLRPATVTRPDRRTVAFNALALGDSAVASRAVAGYAMSFTVEAFVLRPLRFNLLFRLSLVCLPRVVTDLSFTLIGDSYQCAPRQDQVVNVKH